MLSQRLTRDVLPSKAARGVDIGKRSKAEPLRPCEMSDARPATKVKNLNNVGIEGR